MMTGEDVDEDVDEGGGDDVVRHLCRRGKEVAHIWSRERVDAMSNHSRKAGREAR